jgi:hypothetical protein
MTSMRDRQRAMDAIDQALAEAEASLDWLIHNRSQYMEPYTTRLVWPTGLDIESARGRARRLLLQIEEMQMFGALAADVWRVAVQCRALAIIGQDPVTAENAAKIIAQVAPRKKYSAEERREIHRRATALVASFMPSSNRPASKKRYIETEIERARKRAKLIDTGLSRGEFERFRRWYSRGRCG